MINIEKQLHDTRIGYVNDMNEDAFLARLHNRVSESKDNRRTVITSLCMLMVIISMTITQFGAPDIQTDYLYDEDIENFFGTDFYAINSDPLEYDQEFFNNMAYFFFDEGYVWVTVELLNQFELNKEES